MVESPDELLNFTNGKVVAKNPGLSQLVGRETGGVSSGALVEPASPVGIFLRKLIFSGRMLEFLSATRLFELTKLYLANEYEGNLSGLEFEHFMHQEVRRLEGEKSLTRQDKLDRVTLPVYIINYNSTKRILLSQKSITWGTVSKD